MPYLSVLVGNLRGDPDYAPDRDETLVRGDRAHPILGNHGFAMKDKTLYERRRVIEEFARRVDFDARQNGPLTRLLADFGERAARGEKLRFQCWCSPLPCHLHVVAERVKLLAANPGVRATDLPPAGSVIPELFLGLGPSVRAPAKPAPKPAPPIAPEPLAAIKPAEAAAPFLAPPPVASPALSRSGWGRPKN